MFDSPDLLGSGKRFMESEPVWILDEVFRTERLKGLYTFRLHIENLRRPNRTWFRV